MTKLVKMLGYDHYSIFGLNHWTYIRIGIELQEEIVLTNSYHLWTIYIPIEFYPK
jgi:hypothetical protein